MLAQEDHRRLRDRFGRVITDLRLSVTDRCNYRCIYCRSGNPAAATTEVSVVEHERMVRLLAGMGVEKVRITGGEPLLRKDLIPLLRALSTAPVAHSPQRSTLELTLTTNGHLLASMAAELKRAGLHRVTISLDSLTASGFESIVRVSGAFSRVMDGIHAAQDVGFSEVKVNCVLMRGRNDDQVEAFGEFARREKVIFRFIEFMPLDDGHVWSSNTVVTEAEIVDRLSQIAPLQLLPPRQLSETARRYAFTDGVGEIGIIAPVSRPFCGHCSRLRITSDAKLRTCLFSEEDHDLLPLLRMNAADDLMRDVIRTAVLAKEERHHIGQPTFKQPARGMVQIGG